MDLTATAIAMSQYQLQSSLAIGVLKKTLDLDAEQGAALVQMMNQSSGIGQKVDLYA